MTWWEFNVRRQGFIMNYLQERENFRLLMTMVSSIGRNTMSNPSDLFLLPCDIISGNLKPKLEKMEAKEYASWQAKQNDKFKKLNL
jgi:hypothetical protein